MRQFPLEFLQSRAGGNRIVPGGFDSHPFRFFVLGKGQVFSLPAGNGDGIFPYRSAA